MNAIKSEYRESDIKAGGEPFTTIGNYNGLGFGYLMSNGEVYTSAGNGFYYPTRDGVTGLKEFHRDGGRGYQDRARRILGIR